MSKYLFLLFKIHIHPLFWAIAALCIVTAQFQSLCMLFTIVFIHEMGHAICARFFSWRIKHIVLLPFGGVVEVDEYGNRPFKEELYVIISGPIQHVWLQGAALFLSQYGLIEGDFYELFTFYNVSILLFNLIPVWPLDGGKLLFLCLSYFYPFSIAHRQMLLFSTITVCIMTAFFFVIEPFQLNIWLILGFILYSLYTEHKQRMFAFMRFLLERYYGKMKEFYSLKPIVVNSEEYVLEVLLKFQRGCKHQVIVQKGEKKLFQLDENEILHAYFSEKRTNAKVGELMYVY